MQNSMDPINMQNNEILNILATDMKFTDKIPISMNSFKRTFQDLQFDAKTKSLGLLVKKLC